MSLLSPYWLACIPFLLLLLWKFRQIPLQDAWFRVMSRGMLKRLRPASHLSASLSPLVLLACGISLCLSNPASETQRPDTAFAVPETWWALVDLSQSMNQDDISPSRLSATKKILDQISFSAGARPLGMILYTSDAFIAHPPTHDRRSFSDFTQALDTDLIALKGSRPDRALALVQSLDAEKMAYKSRLWLLTDGGGINSETISLARKMANNNYKLDVILTATRNSDTQEAVDSDFAARLAETGNGRLWTMNALGKLYTNPFENPQLASESRSYSLNLTGYHHWSHWLILPLLPLCLWLIVREAY